METALSTGKQLKSLLQSLKRKHDYVGESPRSGKDEQIVLVHQLHIRVNTDTIEQDMFCNVFFEIYVFLTTCSIYHTVLYLSI